MECVLVLTTWRISLVVLHRLFSHHEDSLILCQMKTNLLSFNLYSSFSPDDDRMSRTSNRSDTTFVFANSVKDENSLRRSVGRNTKVIRSSIIELRVPIIIRFAGARFESFLISQFFLVFFFVFIQLGFPFYQLLHLIQKCSYHCNSLIPFFHFHSLSCLILSQSRVTPFHSHSLVFLPFSLGCNTLINGS